MPTKCCVPKCRGNYDSANKVHTFAFPKDPKLKTKWLRNIRRLDFSPSQYASVCERHFKEEEIRWTTTYYSISSEKILSVPLRCPRLVPGSVPTLFPGYSSYFFSNKVPQRTTQKRKLLDPKAMEQALTAFQQAVDGESDQAKVKTEPQLEEVNLMADGSEVLSSVKEEIDIEENIIDPNSMENETWLSDDILCHNSEDSTLNSKCSPVMDKHQLEELDQEVVRDEDNGEGKSCSMCSREFKNMSALKRHMRVHKRRRKLWSPNKHTKKRKAASVCEQSVQQEQEDFENEENESEATENMIFTCFQCNKEYKRKKYFKRHLLYHKKKINAAICEPSDFILNANDAKLQESDISRLKSSVEEIENESDIETGSSFVEKSEDEDLQIKRISCPVCPEVFINKIDFQGHVTMHNGETSFLCSYSSKVYKALVSFDNYLDNNKNPEVKWICSKCHEEFENLSGLRRHENKVCVQDNRELKVKVKVKKPVVCIERPKMTYLCYICGIFLKAGHTFNKHIVLHSQEKNYECNICDKKFAFMLNLNRHINRYHLHKRDDCHLCKKSYFDKGTLRRHLIKIHGHNPKK